MTRKTRWPLREGDVMGEIVQFRDPLEGCLPPPPSDDDLFSAGSAEEPEASNQSSTGSKSDKTGGSLKLTRFGDVAPVEVDWLWRSFLPRGELSILDGDPGTAKTTLCLDVAARLSRGDSMPDGSPTHGPGNTLFLSAEDSIDATLVPRLRAADGDPGRVFASDEPLSFPSGAELLEKTIRDCDAALVVVDPVTAFLDGDVRSHVDADVRRALRPLKQVAAETGATIALIRHLNKMSGGPALYRGGGSIGFTAAARSVLMLAHDPGREGDRVFCPLKSSLCARPGALGYRLIPAGSVARIEWTGPRDIDPEQLAGPPPKQRDDGAVSEAESFLRSELRFGSALADDVRTRAREAGIAKRTLERAKSRVGVRSFKSTFTGQWRWELTALEASS